MIVANKRHLMRNVQEIRGSKLWRVRRLQVPLTAQFKFAQGFGGWGALVLGLVWFKRSLICAIPPTPQIQEGVATIFV
jgi:hypothetical protein